MWFLTPTRNAKSNYMIRGYCLGKGQTNSSTEFLQLIVFNQNTEYSMCTFWLCRVPLNAVRPQNLLSFQSWYLSLPCIIFCSGGWWHKLEVFTGLGVRLICHSLGKSDFFRQYRKPRKSMKMFMTTTWKTQGGRSTALSIATTWLWVVLLSFNTLYYYSTVTLPFKIQNASHSGMKE